MSEATEIHDLPTRDPSDTTHSINNDDKYVILRPTGDGNFALVTQGPERKDALKQLKDEPHGGYLLFRYLGQFDVGPPKRSAVSVVRAV